MKNHSLAIPFERIEHSIYIIRNAKVMLDRDLAGLYGVTTSNLNKAVKRNSLRFPDDFMFQLTQGEYAALRFQTGILKRGRHAKYLPYAFTEHGVAMLSSVLHSNRAIQVNIAIMRTFSRLRQVIAANRELAGKLAELERKVVHHDESIGALFQAIRQLMNPARVKRRPIGFRITD